MPEQSTQIDGRGIVLADGRFAGMEPGMNQAVPLLPRMWRLMRARPKTTVALAAAVIAAAVGLWSCSTTPVSRPVRDPVSGVEPEVRVRIRSGVQAVKLEGPKKFLLRPAGAGAARELDGPVNLSIGPDGVRVEDARGVVPSPGWNRFEVLSAAEGNATPRIRIDTSLYPGRLQFLPRRGGSMAEGNPDGRMDVVTVTGIEDYLVGVVAAELYPDWKSAGVHEVQAICARTYALHQRQRSIEAKQEWDLESTEQDQAYKGGTFKKEAYDGVRNTRGVVLTHKGALLRAYYSSTCGGRTAAAADTWPTTAGFEFNLAGPIQAHARESACQISPRYRWEVTRDRDMLSRQFREFGKSRGLSVGGMGLLDRVDVERVNRNDRPASYVVVDTAGRRYSLSAEQIRLACNFRATGVPAPTAATLVRSGDLEVAVRGSNVVIKGRGFGHGVGMCQFCAKAWSDRGDSWREMLARFYPGATIERAY
ncbi:MAG: SpoIID/LytB domain-containing protein [Phycisphaeraceae bacterium]|nr:SpoIID/LytB domain-containing protein [Phycisphaeraceae bacterium]